MSEWMIERAAAEIADGEWVLLGTPRAAEAYARAQATHAPEALALDPEGAMRRGAEVLWEGSAVEALALLAQGRVDVAIIDGARVDRFGNVNHSYVGPYSAPTERLPGAGLRTDAASLARRVVLLLDHDDALPDEVEYFSAPGAGSGAGWREGAGLQPWASGVTVVLTPTRRFAVGEDGWLVEEGR